MASIQTQRRRKTNANAAIKVACQVGTTANITLSGEQTIDGIAVTEGAEDRVLVKDQTDATENGIYVVSTGAWTRAPDFDGSFDVAEGTLINVSRGTTNADTYWRVTNTGTITVGTTSITFAQGLTDVAISATSTVTDEGTDTTCFPVFVKDATGNVTLHTATAFTYNSATGAIGFTSVAVSSNATVAGTLGVTGTITGSSNAIVEGTFTSSGAATLSSNATVGGTLGVTGAVTASSNATVDGTFKSSGAATLSSNIIGSLLTTANAGTDPGVSGQVWVSTSTGATAGKFLLVSTG